ncbi:ankyrin repeat domain-containing protein 27-like [Mytilus trossulus]|uniref:ankyrin repeat domain-containing protein 27-like n=1 Tax=Mytilus trossulus TaxID=6551 RepID=UPI00300653F9
MVDKYDEDLYENPFFIALQTNFPSLNEEATSSCWTVCIPRYSSVEHGSFTEHDVKDHVIITSQTETDIYSTWSGKKVCITDGKLSLKIGNEENKVPILFEETFYNNSDESYKVLCIGWPLNTIPKDNVKNDHLKTAARPATYEECCKLLFGHSGSRRSRDAVDKLLDSFAKSYKISGEKFVDIVDIASTQYTKVMQTAMKDSSVRRQAQESQANMDNLKFAVEAYMMQAIHKELFQVIVTNFSSQDTDINKMRRNLKDINLNNLGVKSDFISNIVPARKELVRLNSYSTPFGRMKCLKRVVSVLCRPPKRKNSVEESIVITTDDFLPMLIFLIVKSDIPNWMANLMYMKHFHFSRTTDDDEYLYYLTTVEAGLEHIKSGKLTEESSKANIVVFPKHDSKTEINRQTSSSIVDRFFQYVQCGDESAVITLLRKSKSGQDDISPLMCHPLCGCDKCSRLTSQVKTDENLVTAYTRDDRGYTALHIAALHGQAHLIDVLIQHGAIVNASDYLGLTPLHLACQKGFQNIILLLLHFKADVMLTDGVGNTPLHLCVDNGHEDCVKGLVFSDVSRIKLDINAQNERGDTPLHLAAKWGYGTIVNSLLENGADVTIKNRKKQTALSLAQNKNVVQIFTDFATNPKIDMSRSYSQSDLDYSYVKVVKHDHETKRRTESVSLPNTPMVESLDLMEEKQIALLYKAIEDKDIPLVQFHLGWTSLDSEETEPISPNSLEMCHPLCQCKKCTQVQKISGIGKNGLHVRIKDKKGYTPLHRAVLANSLQLVHLFVTKGAKINDVTSKYITPLHLACYLGFTDIANYLVGNGAYVNVKDSMLDTPLHLCCYKGFVDIIDMLIQNHVMVNPSNKQGDLPLHIAVKTQNIDTVRKLLKAGAYVSIRNKDGGIPVFYAKNPDIVELLKIYTKNVIRHDNEQITTPLTQETNGQEKQPKVHHILKATEERDLSALHELCQSIETFDPNSSLRRTSTVDKSSAQLINLQRRLSIRAFDLSTLRHVQSIDKSEPLHIYKLVLKEKSKCEDKLNSSVIENISDENKSEFEEDNFSEQNDVFENADIKTDDAFSKHAEDIKENCDSVETVKDCLENCSENKESNGNDENRSLFEKVTIKSESTED